MSESREPVFAIIGLDYIGKHLLEDVISNAIPKVEYYAQTINQLLDSVGSLDNADMVIFWGNKISFVSDVFAKSAQELSNNGVLVVALVLDSKDVSELPSLNDCDLTIPLSASAQGNCAAFVTDVIDTLVAPILTESVIMLSFSDLSEMVKNSGNGIFSIGVSDVDVDRVGIATDIAINSSIRSNIMKANKVLVCITGKIELEDFVNIGNITKAFIPDQAVAFVTTSGREIPENNIKVSIICA
ncbi:hypothetical protein [Photobacterium kishitanii]|uniref:Cell division protein FtsZ n=1 Tax=Photobacterium kishitanii TaxID=318456 RepID=A0A2T3KKT8_9GAMM|nr:hypothetical protein [Photobacterium kishitanii]PSV00335.1 hypothetical protein C9J27_04205 [Photobacterium kishitanii]